MPRRHVTWAGSLTEVYDELGTKYAIPPFCLTLPANMLPGT